MGMERHEVPTVFVHGHAAPSDVGYVEDRLCAALHDTVVRYLVLRIDTVGGAAVEIEAGIATGPIGARASGPSVRAAGDTCVGLLLQRLSPVGRAS